MIGIVALVIGIVIGVVLQPSVPDVVQPYLPIAVVAALDAVFGGLRAYLEHIFDAKVFVVSFVFNVLVAAVIVYVGDQLGVGTQLSTAIIVVLGIRIFGNAAALALVDKRLQLRVVLGGLGGQRMLCRYGNVGRAHQGIGAGGEDLEGAVVADAGGVVRELDFHAH